MSTKLNLECNAIPCTLEYTEYHNEQGELTELDFDLFISLSHQYVTNVGYIEVRAGRYVIPSQPATTYATIEEAGAALFSLWQTTPTRR